MQIANWGSFISSLKQETDVRELDDCDDEKGVLCSFCVISCIRSIEAMDGVKRKKSSC